MSNEYYYVAPSGRKYRTLPSDYDNASPFNEAWALSHGWTKETTGVFPPAVPARRKCTKYELVNAVKAAAPELLATLEHGYATDGALAFYWNTVQELDRDNEDFQSFATSLGFTSSQLDTVFSALPKL